MKAITMKAITIVVLTVLLSHGVLTVKNEQAQQARAAQVEAENARATVIERENEERAKAEAAKLTPTPTPAPTVAAPTPSTPAKAQAPPPTTGVSCRQAIDMTWPEGLRAAAKIVLHAENGLETANRLGGLNSDGSRDYGCMQINNFAHPGFFAANNWADPVANTRYAYQHIYVGRGNFHAWYAVCPLSGANPYGIC